MKKTFLNISGFLAMIVLLAACNRKASPSGDIQDAGQMDINTPTEEPSTPAQPIQVAGFQKTPCYGKCPVYQVWFYEDGTVKWHGRYYVERMGWYEATVAASVLKEIEKQAMKAGFLELEEKYPSGYRIADLPSTISFIRANGKKKQVTNTHDAPDRLLAFEAYLEKLIEALEWTPASPGK